MKLTDWKAYAGTLRKAWMIMRITTLLILIAALHVSAGTFGQTVTLSSNDMSIMQFFNQLKKQTGYSFLLDDAMVATTKKVSVHVSNVTLEQVLDEILAPMDLGYKIEDKLVYIIRAAPLPAPTAELPEAVIDVSGHISDSLGNPLAGASVSVKGQGRGTTTNELGDFTIRQVSDHAILVFSFTGFISRLYPVNGKNNIQIILSRSMSPLDEAKVIAYGTTTQRNNTGSVSTVNSHVIGEQPVINPIAAIQGRVPGVFVQSTNGLPGGDYKILIRGQGSLQSGTDPLFIIDGVPFLSAPLSDYGATRGANGPISPFTSINPGDIESMSILKDADATSIYGSRGANGVILITTKKGTGGKDIFSVDVFRGENKVSRFGQYLNLEQYLQLRREAYANDNLVPDIYSAPDLVSWDTTHYTNWEKYFYGGTADVTSVQASLSGGNTNNHYLASYSFRNEGSILPGDENYKKGGGFLSLDHSSSDKRFTVSMGVNYNKDDNHTIYSAGNGLGSTPPDFQVYNKDGSYNWDIFNPVAMFQQKQRSQTSYLNVNNLFKYILLPGLDARLSVGYNNYTINQVATLPASSQYPYWAPYDEALFSTNSSERYIFEPQLNYTKNAGGGIFTALLGGTYQHVVNEGNLVEGDGISNPSLLGNIGAASTITSQTNTYSEYKYGSVFGRLNYNWKQRYLLDVNVRRDGSSRFGPGKQFGNFYAVGAGWVFSQEDLVKRTLPFLSFGKLRGSYGLTGNDQISDYQYLSTYRSAYTYGNTSTLSSARIANPDYGWETTKKGEIALELGFLKDRILFTSAFYHNISGNQLIDYSLPDIAGFSSYQANFPAVIRNTGLELELHAQPVKGKDFSWKTDFNITIPKNKLLSFPNIAGSSYAYTYVVGQDLSVWKDYQFTGVNPQTGRPTFKDINKDGMISFPQDEVVLGKQSPVFFGGLNNSFFYKGLELDAFFEFVKRDYPNYAPNLGTDIANTSVVVLNRWRKPGDISSMPGATTNYSNIENYGLFLSPIPYVRFKNLSFSYDLKSTLLKKSRLQELKFYLRGENLLVFANRKNIDPEMLALASNIGPLRTFVAGIKLTL